MSFKTTIFQPTNSKKVLVTCLFVIFMAVLVVADNNDIWDNIPDHVAAVDQRVITRKKLMEKLLDKKNTQYYRSLSPSQFKAEIMENLNAMIGRMLLEDMIAKENAKVSTDEIKKRFAEMLAHMNPEQAETLYSRLRRQKITINDYIASIVNDENTRFSMELRKLIEQKFPGKLEITEDQCERYYRENQTSFEMPLRVNISRIFISLASQKRLLLQNNPNLKADELSLNSDKAALEKIENIRKTALETGNFAALAIKYSNCPSAANGGVIGSFFKQGGLDAVTEKVAFSLTPGVISDVIPVEDGYQLIRVNKFIMPGYATIEEVKDFIREDMQNQITEKLAGRLVREAKPKHHIFIYLGEVQ